MPLKSRAFVAFVLTALALLLAYFPENRWLWRGLALAGCSVRQWFLARGDRWARLLYIAVASVAFIAVIAWYAAHTYWQLSFGPLFFLSLLLLLLAWPVGSENDYGQAIRAKCKGYLAPTFAAIVSVISAGVGYLCAVNGHHTGGLEGGAGLNKLGGICFAMFMLFVGALFGAMVGRTLDIEE